VMPLESKLPALLRRNGGNAPTLPVEETK